MEFKHYDDIKLFFFDTFDILIRHESQNLIPLGNIIIGNEGTDKTGWRDTTNWFMATVSDENGINLTAVMTPPHNLTLYATDNKIDDSVLTCLVTGILESDFVIPGVMSENALAESFANTYSKICNRKYSIRKKQRIYELLQVTPNIPLVGSLRMAGEPDMSFFPYWLEGFKSDCFGLTPKIKNDMSDYRYHIASGKMYFLEDNGIPVSMAKINREMETACGISYVYTPPYFRGKGYATSCVSALSSLALNRGFTRCVLYTDLENPASNSIYQKIGYRQICDSLEIVFY